MNFDYNVLNDIDLVKEILEMNDNDIAECIGIKRLTISRARNNNCQFSYENVRKFYEYAYDNEVYINKIKAQLYFEQAELNNKKLLFHGSKEEIEGEISIEKSKKYKDFGQGFYCGESLEQSSMFVSTYQNSSLYILEFNNEPTLKFKKYNVNLEWMLTIAICRNTLNEFENNAIVKKIKDDLCKLDYVIAPIADNRMYQIIDDFISGNITDLQCEHALSATNLGYQYVFLTQRALDNLKIIEHCFLASNEKNDYSIKQLKENKLGYDKAKIAKREYRGQGKYIDEIIL